MQSRDEPWPPGTPAWTDLSTPDREQAKAFYGGLLGWEFTEHGPALGHYVQAHVGGRAVAGIGEGPPDQPTTRAEWSTYLAVADVEATSQRAVRAGGTAETAAADLGDLGRMAVISDPGGALVGLWQAGAHVGARLVNAPGAMCWNEAHTRDFEAALAFYTDVFGYEVQDLSGPGFQYAGLQVAGRTVCGLGAIGQELQGARPRWLTYFAVERADATVARAVSLGGRSDGARDSAYGRMAVITGPQGEDFAVIEPAGTAQGPDTWT